MSLTMISLAPAALATCTFISPMGPAPEISTRLPIAYFGFAAGPDPDRKRFDEACAVVADGVGDGVGEVGGDGHVFGEGSVDGWGGEELDVGAQVVPAVFALAAVAAWHARFEGHPLSDPVGRHVGADRDDDAAGFVSQDEWCADDVLGDAAVPVVVHVGTADADRADPDQDLIVGRPRHRPLFRPHHSG